MSARYMQARSVFLFVIALLLVFVIPHIWPARKIECDVAGLSASIMAVVYEVGAEILKRLERKS